MWLLNVVTLTYVFVPGHLSPYMNEALSMAVLLRIHGE